MNSRVDSIVPEDRFAVASGEDRGGRRQRLNRRQFLRRSVFSAAGLLSGWDSLYPMPAQEPVQGGKLVGLVNFDDQGRAPLGAPIGTELDGRLYTDLSRVSTHRQVTPTAEFYIRTAVSRLLPEPSRWRIDVDGLVSKPSHLDIPMLQSAAKPMGLHLMECAGNVRLTRFGLISVANWTGVPIASILDDAQTSTQASWVEVAGFDEYAGSSATSVPGASWVFPRDALKASGAFLATEMNSRPLTADHGAPIRLVVPGWYGCACIKWVNRIAPVDDRVPATSQMQEYAARTLQEGRPEVAQDYQPATIDHAAMPVRVEKWAVAEKVRYRVVGILWGGSQIVTSLKIRFNSDQEFAPVSGFRQVKTDPWTVWTHPWSPRAPGMYTIRMAITGPAVRARKLDMGLYDRSVYIEDL